MVRVHQEALAREKLPADRITRDIWKERFLERLDNPEKNWKFSTNNIKERTFWDDYMNAYEQTIRHTSSKHAPWYVVPADNQWFTRIAVAAAIIKTLDSLGLHYPELSQAARSQLVAARAQLEQE